MTDELVKRLRYLSRVFRKHDVEDLTYDDYLSAQLYPDEAADRIEQLVATNEALTAERDRLRKELENIANDYEAGYPLSHDAIKYAARAALKGDS